MDDDMKRKLLDDFNLQRNDLNNTFDGLWDSLPMASVPNHKHYFEDDSREALERGFEMRLAFRDAIKRFILDYKADVDVYKSAE